MVACADGPTRLWLRYKGSVVQPAIENLRLATAEEEVDSRFIVDAMEEIEDELTAGRRPAGCDDLDEPATEAPTASASHSSEPAGGSELRAPKPRRGKGWERPNPLPQKKPWCSSIRHHGCLWCGNLKLVPDWMVTTQEPTWPHMSLHRLQCPKTSGFLTQAVVLTMAFHFEGCFCGCRFWAVRSIVSPLGLLCGKLRGRSARHPFLVLESEMASFKNQHPNFQKVGDAAHLLGMV